MVVDGTMENHYCVTGLMSGSSLDGVDLACCEFEFEELQWNHRILRAETVPYPESLAEKLNRAMDWNRRDLERLDRETGEYYASVLNHFHSSYKLNPDLISSHGHTILHEPAKGITLQVGNGRIMADLTGVPVVNDFRTEDVQAGGQGAPLVPVGDRLLFGEYGACLNLGGFANISYEGSSGKRLAFDIGPANLPLNWLAGLAGKPFDFQGEIARSGRVDESLLRDLNHLEYYKTPPPKSLGKEWFLGSFLPVLENSSATVHDLMATTVEHLAIQTGKGITRSGAHTVLITGGGAFNTTLVEKIRKHTIANLVLPDRLLIEFKEALIFALLGLLRIRREINCLASVTGGSRDLSAGTIYLP
jgi:anhydro-N-acetylmuramic acid kinase